VCPYQVHSHASRFRRRARPPSPRPSPRHPRPHRRDARSGPLERDERTLDSCPHPANTRASPPNGSTSEGDSHPRTSDSRTIPRDSQEGTTDSCPSPAHSWAKTSNGVIESPHPNRIAGVWVPVEKRAFFFRERTPLDPVKGVKDVDAGATHAMGRGRRTRRPPLERRNESTWQRKRKERVRSSLSRSSWLARLECHVLLLRDDAFGAHAYAARRDDDLSVLVGVRGDSLAELQLARALALFLPGPAGLGPCRDHVSRPDVPVILVVLLGMQSTAAPAAPAAIRGAHTTRMLTRAEPRHAGPRPQGVVRVELRARLYERGGRDDAARLALARLLLVAVHRIVVADRARKH
jgi:hypothetical protein